MISHIKYHLHELSCVTIHYNLRLLKLWESPANDTIFYLWKILLPLAYEAHAICSPCHSFPFFFRFPDREHLGRTPTLSVLLVHIPVFLVEFVLFIYFLLVSYYGRVIVGYFMFTFVSDYFPSLVLFFNIFF